MIGVGIMGLHRGGRDFGRDGLQAQKCPVGVSWDLVYAGGKPDWVIGQMGLFLQATVKVG